MQSTKNINKYGKGRDRFIQPNRVGCQVKFPVGHQCGPTAPPVRGQLPSWWAWHKHINYFHLGSVDFQRLPASPAGTESHCMAARFPAAAPDMLQGQAPSQDAPLSEGLYPPQLQHSFLARGSLGVLCHLPF